MMDILSSFLNLVPVTLAQSLLYGFVALGIMIPFRLLSFPDLTCEGSFPLGGCLCAALLVAGVAPVLSMLIAILAGVLAGCATAFIHLRFKINTLLAGILMITILWSINLRIMGKSNIPLFAAPSFFDGIYSGFTLNVPVQIAFWLLVAIALVALLRWFLSTDLGLALRATGANEVMARAQGINTWAITIAGVGAANGLTAFAGASVAQVQGYADVQMGFGILINALAALIIGEAVVGRTSIFRQLLAPFVGSIVYYQVISAGLALGLHPSDLKLVTGLFVLIMLALPMRKSGGVALPERPVNA
jgi:putative ABC transport system permease protein